MELLVELADGADATRSLALVELAELQAPLSGRRAARPPSISARIAAAKEEVSKSQACLSWIVPIVILADIGALLLCAVTAWFSTPLLLVLVVLILASMDACQVGLLRVWRSPARVLCDSRGSLFGLHSEQPGSCWPVAVKVELSVAAFFFAVHASSMILRSMKVFVARESLTQCLRHDQKADQQCHGKGVPGWMPCDYIDTDSYVGCVQAAAWWARGVCNIMATQCYLDITAAQHQYAVSYTIVYGPVILFIVHLMLKCCIRIKPKDEKAMQSIQERAREIDADVAAGTLVLHGPWDIMFDFAVFVLDWLVLDLVSIYNFYATENYYFGGIALALYVKTLDDFFTVGGPSEAFKQCRESIREGRQTDIGASKKGAKYTNTTFHCWEETCCNASSCVALPTGQMTNPDSHQCPMLARTCCTYLAVCFNAAHSNKYT